MKWQTRVTSQFPCTVPIIGAPMSGIAGGMLAAEVCRAGGLGFIGAGNLSPIDFVEEQIRIFRTEQEKIRHSDTNNIKLKQQSDPTSGTSGVQDKSSYPLCLGFLSFGIFHEKEGWERFGSFLHRHKPSVIQFFAPSVVYKDGSDNKITNISFSKECCNCQVLAQVGTVAEAIQAVEAGADGLIIQGSEAGGHGMRREYGNGTLSLALDVTSKFPDIPVIAAGGIVDGRGLASVLMAGCDGAILGTRLWASTEAIGDVARKNALIHASSCDAVIRTRVLDAIGNSIAAVPWPAPYDSVGALRNQMTDTWDDRIDELHKELNSNDSTLAADFAVAMQEFNVETSWVLSGKGVGLIDKIELSYDIVTEINQDAMHILQTRPKMLLE